MPVDVNIRMYNQQNLGDCFLLTFTNDKGALKHMLIDFGSYTGNTEVERKIATDISQTVGENELTIVLTHQHKDHLSGFRSSKEILEGMPGDKRLWLSFLDDEASVIGKELRSVTEKYWKKSKKATDLMKANLAGIFKGDKKVEAMLKAKEHFDLFAEDQTSGKAVTDLLDIVDHQVSFLTPGDNFFLPGFEEQVKVYVLGPPKDKGYLTKMDPVGDEEVTALSAASDNLALANFDLSGTLMLDAIDAITDPNRNATQSNFPFDRLYQNTSPAVKKRYESDAGRSIDFDWLNEVGRMALHMDKFTNNSSLVLAFELVETKRVLLFVGDAQIGNWQSWFKVEFKNSKTTAEELLGRTIVYKAGHHSSLNATLRKGLDLMNDKELVILIPVNEKISHDKGFHMLKEGMLRGYNRKSHGRVFRSDTIEQLTGFVNLADPFAKVADMKGRIKVNIPDGETEHLSIDLLVSENPPVKAPKPNIANVAEIAAAMAEPVIVEHVTLEIKRKPQNKRPKSPDPGDNN